MKIVVFSCDNCKDTFIPFHHCLEKYYPDHPEVIYITETIKNPYYKTICKNYPLDLWTKKIREALKEINTVEIAILFKELPNGFTKVSFRSKTVDVSKISEKFDGGGHSNASGCTIKKPINTILNCNSFVFMDKSMIKTYKYKRRQHSIRK